MKKLVLALAVLGFGSAAAFAQTADYATTDANADGMVTMEEATAAGFDWAAEDFKKADADANGSLSAEEFAAATAE